MSADYATDGNALRAQSAVAQVPRFDLLRISSQADRGVVIASSRRMTPDELRSRTKRFAIEVVRFAKTLPADQITMVMTRQLVKSAMSVGANYRSSCRAKSKPDFVAKMAIAEEEADEARYWLEVLVESGTVKPETIAGMLDEADQLVRIFVASIKTARGSRP